MKPLIVLLTVFVVALFTTKLISQNYDPAFSGRTAMSVMLLFTAIGHFVYTKGMTMMMPAVIPFKIQLVYLTGIIEMVAAVGLQIPGYRVLTGWLLILFFLVLLPSNIKAGIDHIDYQKATSDGPGVKYLWFRIPLQIFFIAWIYFSAIKF